MNRYIFSLKFNAVMVITRISGTIQWKFRIRKFSGKLVELGHTGRHLDAEKKMKIETHKLCVMLCCGCNEMISRTNSSDCDFCGMKESSDRLVAAVVNQRWEQFDCYLPSTSDLFSLGQEVADWPTDQPTDPNDCKYCSALIYSILLVHYVLVWWLAISLSGWVMSLATKCLEFVMTSQSM